MRRVVVLLLAAAAAAGVPASAGAAPCCDPPCKLVWDKPTVTVDPTSQHPVTVTLERPMWVC